VDRNNGMFIVDGVDLTKRAQPVVFARNSSASTSWVLVKVDMVSSVCSSIQPVELLLKQRIPRELVAKLAQELSRARKVLLAAFGNGQKDAGVRSKIMASLGDQPQFSHALLLVAREAAHSKNPTHRRRHGTDQVSADSSRNISVVAVSADSQ